MEVIASPHEDTEDCERYAENVEHEPG